VKGFTIATCSRTHMQPPQTRASVPRPRYAAADANLKLEAAQKCRSCRTPRYFTAGDMIQAHEGSGRSRLTLGCIRTMTGEATKKNGPRSRGAELRPLLVRVTCTGLQSACIAQFPGGL